MAYNIATYREQTVSSDGTAVIQLGPRKVGERWIISTISTSGNSNPENHTPKLEIYRNGHELLAGSWNANFDTATGDINLRQNEFIRCLLVGGEPGARWTISVGGTGHEV